MTPAELEALLKRLGMNEGEATPISPKKISLTDNPKVSELVSLFEGVREMLQKEVMQEEAKIVALQEKLVKKKKGGCNG